VKEEICSKQTYKGNDAIVLIMGTRISGVMVYAPSIFMHLKLKEKLVIIDLEKKFVPEILSNTVLPRKLFLYLTEQRGMLVTPDQREHVPKTSFYKPTSN
jgi:hypothetical protein